MDLSNFDVSLKIPPSKLGVAGLSIQIGLLAQLLTISTQLSEEISLRSGEALETVSKKYLNMSSELEKHIWTQVLAKLGE